MDNYRDLLAVFLYLASTLSGRITFGATVGAFLPLVIFNRKYYVFQEIPDLISDVTFEKSWKVSSALLTSSVPLLPRQKASGYLVGGGNQVVLSCPAGWFVLVFGDCSESCNISDCCRRLSFCCWLSAVRFEPGRTGFLFEELQKGFVDSDFADSQVQFVPELAAILVFWVQN
jgi:hypothetical protein